MDLLVAVGHSWEARLVERLSSVPGVVVSRRCVDLAELLSAVAAGHGDVAVVSGDLRGLDRESVAQVARHGVRVVGASPDGSEARERELRQLGVAGVLQSLVTNTGSPVFGSELTVMVIAAVVVGGTRLEGGRGSALGTLGGVLTIGSLTVAMEFQSVPAYIQQVVSGCILILLVVLDRTVHIRPGAGREPARAVQPITQGGGSA